MYKKSAIKKIGSIVVVAALIASAFTMISVGETEPVSSDTVMINEIMYDPASGDDEWIELYNPGDSEVNVSEWTLMDGDNQTFGDLTGVSIPAGGYYVVTCAMSLLNNDGDTVTLYDGETVVDTASYDDGAAAPNYSLERTHEGTWMQSQVEGGTPDARNSVYDLIPPEITNVMATPTTQKKDGTVNITCDVTDNVDVDMVKVHVTGPEGYDANETMTEGSYYYSHEYTVLGTYSYTIWANDTSGNANMSATHTFTIITNFEVKPGSGYYGTTMSMTAYNATERNIVELYKPGGTTPTKTKLSNTDGEAAFSDVSLDVAGEWTVKDQASGNETTFTVMPANLTVTVTPAEITYDRGEVYNFDVTIEDEGGNPVEGADITVYYIDENGDNVAAISSVNDEGNGNYSVETTGLEGIGIYNITAMKNTTGSATAEWVGYAHATITPNDLTFDDVSDKEARAGFPSTTKFLVKYADTNQSVDWTKHVNVTLTYKSESNSTGDVDLSSGDATVVIDGETATISLDDGNLTVTMQWPDTGEYDLAVKQDYAGDAMLDNMSYEYTGSTTFDVVSPPDVNVDVTPDTVDVNDTGNNTAMLEVQVLGDGIDVYGSPGNLSVNPTTMQNVTKRIMVEGDILYSPPKEAYTYAGDGIWHVKVFPTMGDGMIYVNVTWPNNGTDSDTVEIKEGGHVTVDPATVIVDNHYNFTVTVRTNAGDTVTRAEYIRLYIEDPAYYNDTDGWTLVDEKVGAYNTNGEFTFDNVSIDRAAVNYVVAVYFKTATDQYAFARIRSNPAHDLEVDWAPAEVMAGASTEHTFNVTKDNNSYADSFQAYLLNETQYTQLQNEELDLGALTPLTANTANFTVDKTIVEPGTYYLYLRTADKKHDNLGAEPSITVSAPTVAPDMDMLVKHIDDNATVTFEVTWNGDNLDGTLTVHGIDEGDGVNETYVENATLTVDVVNGTATVHNIKVINGSKNGYEITFTFKPDGGMDADADGTMTATIPDITVEPETIMLGEHNIITVTVTNPRNGDPVPGMEVKGDFPTGMMTIGETDSNGEIVIGTIPDITGTITLFVEGDEAGEITIDVGGLKIHVIGERYFYVLPELEKGKEYTIKVTTGGGKEIQGATVKIGGTTIGTTDKNGELKWEPDEKGDFTITATMGVYEQGSRDVKVKEGPSTPGFGFAALVIGVLGAALILWRRRH